MIVVEGYNKIWIWFDMIEHELFEKPLHFSILGWKVSVEQQLSDLHLNKLKGGLDNTAAIYDNIRSTAFSIYEQYLGEKAEQKVQLKPTVVQTLHFKIRNLSETPSELWFEQVSSQT